MINSSGLSTQDVAPRLAHSALSSAVGMLQGSAPCRCYRQFPRWRLPTFVLPPRALTERCSDSCCIGSCFPLIGCWQTHLPWILGLTWAQCIARGRHPKGKREWRKRGRRAETGWEKEGWALCMVTGMGSLNPGSSDTPKLEKGPGWRSINGLIVSLCRRLLSVVGIWGQPVELALLKWGWKKLDHVCCGALTPWILAVVWSVLACLIAKVRNKLVWSPKKPTLNKGAGEPETLDLVKSRLWLLLTVSHSA